jgi:hypothetical protein
MNASWYSVWTIPIIALADDERDEPGDVIPVRHHLAIKLVKIFKNQPDWFGPPNGHSEIATGRRGQFADPNISSSERPCRLAVPSYASIIMVGMPCIGSKLDLMHRTSLVMSVPILRGQLRKSEQVRRDTVGGFLA